MKAKLIKLEYGYALVVDNTKLHYIDSIYGKVIADTLSDNVLQLSLKNCQAIERGYDLDELISAELDKLPYTKHLDDGQYNDGRLVGFELGAYWGFQKALMLMGDKKFSEVDVANAIHKYYLIIVDEDRKNLEISEKYKLIKSLQQNEWDVEICCYIGNGDKESDSFKDPIVTNTGIPKLDANGCLILRRI